MSLLIQSVLRLLRRKPGPDGTPAQQPPREDAPKQPEPGHTPQDQDREREDQDQR